MVARTLLSIALFKIRYWRRTYYRLAPLLSYSELSTLPEGAPMMLIVACRSKFQYSMCPTLGTYIPHRARLGLTSLFAWASGGLELLPISSVQAGVDETMGHSSSR